MGLPQLGEQLAGAYYQLIEECEMVSYNVNTGGQNEMDILALKSSEEQQAVYACEVATHLDGLDYSKTAMGDSWNHLEAKRARGNLEKIEQKFSSDFNYVRRRYPEADVYNLHFWSPYVPVGSNTVGLTELMHTLERHPKADTEQFINHNYHRAIRRIRGKAKRETKQRGIPAYRVLQILEHIR